MSELIPVFSNSYLRFSHSQTIVMQQLSRTTVKLAFTRLKSYNFEIDGTNVSGLHEQLSLLVLKLGVSPNTGEGTVLAAIRCLSALLNYVMSVVKKALQVTIHLVLFKMLSF